MSENDALTPSPPEKSKSAGKWKKGVCPNPKGRGKGNLSKTTKFLQIMTSQRQKQAMRVLDATLRDAEAGDKESRKLVVSLILPFLKREAENEGPGGDKRPLINLNIGIADGRKPAVIDVGAK